MRNSRSSRRCLLLCYVYPPSAGGIETVSRLLAEGLSERGYDIRVVTMTPAGLDFPPCSYPIIRAPNPLELCRQLQWSDVVLQPNFSLRLAWPLVCHALARPWIVVHHTPLTRPNGVVAIRDRLKLAAIRQARCYAVSSYLASETPGHSAVLYNPYDDNLFRLIDGCVRSKPLIFVGRLVPAKGLDVLLRALALLRHQLMTPTLTVVGGGPSEDSLKQLAVSLGLGAQVQFLGSRNGPELAQLLNEHQILVVPSRAAPPEALGIVSLEGIASGCVVIAANQGGLPESIGSCGVTFPSESTEHLAMRIRELLESPDRQRALRDQRESFLKSFQRQSILQQYHLAIEHAIDSFAAPSVTTHDIG